MSLPAPNTSLRSPLDDSTSIASSSGTSARSSINTLTSDISGSRVELAELSLSYYNINTEVASVWRWYVLIPLYTEKNNNSDSGPGN